MWRFDNLAPGARVIVPNTAAYGGEGTLWFERLIVTSSATQGSAGQQAEPPETTPAASEPSGQTLSGTYVFDDGGFRYVIAFSGNNVTFKYDYDAEPGSVLPTYSGTYTYTQDNEQIVFRWENWSDTWINDAVFDSFYNGIWIGEDMLYVE